MKTIRDELVHGLIILVVTFVPPIVLLTLFPGLLSALISLAWVVMSFIATFD